MDKNIQSDVSTKQGSKKKLFIWILIVYVGFVIIFVFGLLFLMKYSKDNHQKRIKNDILSYLNNSYKEDFILTDSEIPRGKAFALVDDPTVKVTGHPVGAEERKFQVSFNGRDFKNYDDDYCSYFIQEFYREQFRPLVDAEYKDSKFDLLMGPENGTGCAKYKGIEWSQRAFSKQFVEREYSMSLVAYTLEPYLGVTSSEKAIRFNKKLLQIENINKLEVIRLRLNYLTSDNYNKIKIYASDAPIIFPRDVDPSYSLFTEINNGVQLFTADEVTRKTRLKE